MTSCGSCNPNCRKNDQIIIDKISDLSGVVDKHGEELSTIKNNHLAHVQTALDTLSADMDWVKKLIWVVLTATTASFLAHFK